MAASGEFFVTVDNPLYRGWGYRFPAAFISHAVWLY